MAESQSTQATRSSRGPTQMHKLAIQRVKGVKLDVDLNARGQAIGPNADALQSYIGVIARDKVNITYPDWRKVLEDIKEKIWDAVNLSFNVPPTFKKECLKSANDKWRQYKSHLTADIEKTLRAKGSVQNPPPGSGIATND